MPGPKSKDPARQGPPPAGAEAPKASSAQWRKLSAESWGTFLLVLVSTAASAQAHVHPEKVSAAAAAVAPGLTVMAVIYFMGEVSGAHINPAVTLAFAVRRNFPWRQVPGYVGAQLIGACLAAGVSRVLFGATAALGESHPGSGFDLGRALAVEALLTAGLVNTILGTASGARNVGPNAAIAVGGYIALAGLWAGEISGASMNPARSLGPAAVDGHLAGSWIYIAGPLAGALAGVALEWMFKGPPTPEGTRAAQGEGPS